MFAKLRRTTYGGMDSMAGLTWLCALLLTSGYGGISSSTWKH